MEDFGLIKRYNG